jgi:acyl carrier protein
VILDEAGNPLSQGETGEIAIRGKNVSSCVVPGANGEREGWFRTGDIGFLDNDNYLFISGRVKEIINRGGEKISPREIDEVMLEHPAIAQAVACSVPDQTLGEDVIAVLVRHAGTAVSERELREFAAARLAPFKVPRRVIFVDDIPKGNTGKIQRIGLANRLGIKPFGFTQYVETVALPRTQTESVLVEIYAQVLGLDHVGIHDNFFELGGNSLASVEVVTRVERRLGVKINARHLLLGTLQQVAAGCDAQIRVDGPVRRAGWTERIFGWLCRQ